MSRSLAASNRTKELTKSAFSKRLTDRNLMAEDTLSTEASFSDMRSRLRQFILKFCDPKDNRGNLNLLCMKTENNKALFNRDINYTATIDSPMTLDVDLTNTGSNLTDDEQALFALSANLFAHDLPLQRTEAVFMTNDQKPNMAGAAGAYMDWRALSAKRSVATNSFSAIIAEKVKGDTEAQPFLYSFIQEMTRGQNGSLSPEEIEAVLGDKPSYHAQMEVLTKKLYQNPSFYSDLYDKPANVKRKDVAIQAATLMQKRDLYRSYLRSEMLLAVMLETALKDEQTRIDNEFSLGRGGGDIRDPRQ